MYKFCSSNGPEVSYTSTFHTYMRQDPGEQPATVKDVVDLMENGGLMDKGYDHTDNWYCIIPLPGSEEKNVVGTVRTNHKYMP